MHHAGGYVIDVRLGTPPRRRGYVGRMPTADQHLDSLVTDLFPVLRGDRDALAFLFDPAALEGRGTIRDYYLEYLRWLAIPAATLPPERVYLHANRPCPANLELLRQSPLPSAPVTYSLYIDMGLYRSTDALRMALAHELTHLYLLLNGHQVLPAHVTSTGATSALSDSEEVRTDVASILLGFGKLVLNGASDYAQVNLRAGYVAQLGYLPVASYAYLYQKVNDLVGVPRNVALAGLNAAAKQAISAASR